MLASETLGVNHDAECTQALAGDSGWNDPVNSHVCGIDHGRSDSDAVCNVSKMDAVIIIDTGYICLFAQKITSLFYEKVHQLEKSL